MKSLLFTKLTLYIYYTHTSTYILPRAFLSNFVLNGPFNFIFSLFENFKFDLEKQRSEHILDTDLSRFLIKKIFEDTLD